MLSTRSVSANGASPRVDQASGPEHRSPAELKALEHRDVQVVRERVDTRSGPVVDGVADLGIDATGQQPVDSELQGAADRGEVVKLPPGDYMLTSPVRTSSSGWGVVGTGESPRDVRLHAPGRMILIRQDGGRYVRFANFAMVNGRNGEVGTRLYDGRGTPRGVGLSLTVDNGLSIRNIEHIGVSPREGVSGDLEEFDHQEGSLTLNIASPTGVGVVDGFRKTSPTEISGHAENDAAINSWAEHEGICYVRNSRFAGGGGDGCTYVSRSPGGWRFTNCVFRAFTASALRLGGGRDWARRCTIIMSSPAVRRRNNVLDGIDAGMNGITWESASGIAPGGRNQAGGLIDGCRIVMQTIDETQGGINIDGSAGGLVVRNTTIVNHSQWDSIAVDAPGSSFMNDFEIPEGPHPVYLRNVTLTGSGSGAAIDAERQVVATGLSERMPNAGIQGPVRREAPVRPPFAAALLAMQGEVPNPAQAIGASGAVAAGRALGGAALTLIASVAVAVLLLIAVMAIAPIVIFGYLFD